MSPKKRSMMKKSMQVSSLTLLSRAFGMIRDALQGYYLGAGVHSDAFLTAFRIPNTFRQIFAEGALSAALVPTLTKIKREGDQQRTNSLLSISMLFFAVTVSAISAIFMLFPDWAVWLFAPGFSAGRLAETQQYLVIMFPFILIVSMCAILTAALHSVHHFWSPALAPVLLNLVLIATLIACIHFNLPITWLCYGVLLAGLAKLIPRIIMFRYHNFSLTSLTWQSWHDFKLVLGRFWPCLAGAGITHINVLLDTIIGSWLPVGQVTLIHYAYRIMHAPLAVIGTTLSVTMLPYFSNVALYAPKRLGFYLLETAKLIFTLALPCTLFFAWTAPTIFQFFFAGGISPQGLIQASRTLQILGIGIAIASLNKVIIKLFYSLGNTKTPTTIVGFATGAKVLGNIFAVSVYGGIYGIATATVMCEIVTTPILLFFLKQQHQLPLFGRNFANFLIKLCAPLCLIAGFMHLAFWGNQALAAKAFVQSPLLLVIMQLLFFGLAFATSIMMSWILKDRLGLKLTFLRR